MSQEILGRISGGESLTSDEMQRIMDEIMQGLWSPEHIGLLLVSLKAKGETVDEVVGAARSLRENMIPIRCRKDVYLDTCGTGGDGSQTFNISTAAAIVAAAAGLPIAKHGNRSVSSRSGSSDVLTALGVNVGASVECVEGCLDEIGICFCYAPLQHQSMKHVATVRSDLGVPTIFNLLGPLCNPAKAPFQLLGVGKPELRPLMAEALQRLGVQRAVVVSGTDGLDEVTLGGATHVSVSTPEGIDQLEWTPEQFGLERADKSHFTVAGPEESAQRVRDILAGSRGPSRDIVVLNAAAALWTADPSRGLEACAEATAESIDSGAAQERLLQLAKRSHEPIVS